jgi:Domain of unknown function (DUF4118)
MRNRTDSESLSVLVGVVAAIGLGMALTALRTVTSPSNLAFVFIVLTLVVAETGGRRAAIVTALVSAMSLNFFLIEPYLTLTISKRDDLIAFIAMLVAGLIAAAFGKRRTRWATVASGARAHLQTLSRIAQRLDIDPPSLDAIVDEIRRSFRLGRVALRDAKDRLLAVSPPESRVMVVDVPHLQYGTLTTTDTIEHRIGARGFRIPPTGGRVTLSTIPPLSLDLWEGDDAGLDGMDWLALSLAASLLGRIRPPPQSSRLAN